MRSVRVRHEVRHATRDRRWKSRLKTKEVGKEDEPLWLEHVGEGDGRQKASCIVRKSDILTARLTSLSSRER